MNINVSDTVYVSDLSLQNNTAPPGVVEFSRSFNTTARTTSGTINSYTDKVSLGGWVFITGYSNLGNFPTIISKGGNLCYFLIVNPSEQLSFNIQTSGGEKGSGTISTALPRGRWVFIAGTYDKDAGASNLKVYMFERDGSLIGSSSSTQTLAMNINTGAFINIMEEQARGYKNSGMASDVFVFNRVLTQQEFLDFILTETLDQTSIGGRWKLEETSGTTMNDSSSASNPGTFTNPLFSTQGPKRSLVLQEVVNISVSDSVTLSESVDVLRAGARDITVSDSVTVTENKPVTLIDLVSEISNLDQHQDTANIAFGFGEFAGTRYRGQIFTASISSNLLSIGFDRVKGTQGIKVYIDTASGNVPDNTIAAALYSFKITNANVRDGYYVYNLPVPLALTAGTKYCFYLAPWDTVNDIYADDYRDVNGVASGFDEITNTAGTWFNEGGVTFHFATYMGLGDTVTVSDLTSLGMSISINKSESITLTENVNLQLVSVVSTSDSVVLTESISNNLVNLISKSDSISVAESYSSLLVHQVNLSDSVTVTENKSASLQATNTLSFSVSDSVTVTENNQIADTRTVTTSDSVTTTEYFKVNTFVVSVSDYVSVQDLRSNLVVNPSFELNSNGWWLEGDYTRTNEDAFNGTYSIKQVSSGGFSNFYQNDSGMSVLPNKTYILSFYYKLTVNSGFTPIVAIAQGGPFNTWISSIALTASSVWARATLTFNTGDNTIVYIRVLNNNGDVVAFYDAFQVEIGNVATNYFDGDSANSQWNGTPGASISSTASNININTAFNTALVDNVTVSENYSPVVQDFLPLTPGKSESVVLSESVNLRLEIYIAAGFRKGIIIT